MTIKKRWNAEDQVTLLAGIEKHWRGFLLNLAGKLLVLLVAGLQLRASLPGCQ